MSNFYFAMKDPVAAVKAAFAGNQLFWYYDNAFALRFDPATLIVVHSMTKKLKTFQGLDWSSFLKMFDKFSISQERWSHE